MAKRTNIHSIRLIGPWELQKPDGPERVHLPRDWAKVAGDRRIELRLSRRFHRPTRLNDSTLVTIVMPAVWDVPALRINGQPIAVASQLSELQKFDVSAIVKSQEAHELELIVRNGQAAPFLVAIEINSGDNDEPKPHN